MLVMANPSAQASKPDRCLLARARQSAGDIAVFGTDSSYETMSEPHLTPTSKDAPISRYKTLQSRSMVVKLFDWIFLGVVLADAARSISVHLARVDPEGRTQRQSLQNTLPAGYLHSKYLQG